MNPCPVEHEFIQAFALRSLAGAPLQSGYGFWPALIKPLIYSRVDLFLISNTSGLCMKKKITVGAWYYTPNE